MMAMYLTTQLVTSSSPTYSFPHHLMLPLILRGCYQISVATWPAIPLLNHHHSCLNTLFTTFLHSDLISSTTSTLPSIHFSSHTTGITLLTPALPPWAFTNVTTHTSSYASISNCLMKLHNIKMKAHMLSMRGRKADPQVSVRHTPALKCTYQELQRLTTMLYIEHPNILCNMSECLCKWLQ